MLTIRGKRILAISPQLDDVELGAGGSVYQLGKGNELWSWPLLDLLMLTASGNFRQAMGRCAGLREQLRENA